MPDMKFVVVNNPQGKPAYLGVVHAVAPLLVYVVGHSVLNSGTSYNPYTVPNAGDVRPATWEDFDFFRVSKVVFQKHWKDYGMPEPV